MVKVSLELNEGINIPTFCYDERLKGDGACRMCVVEVKAIGVFHMADEKGQDEKVICVPVSDPIWNNLNDLSDMFTEMIDKGFNFVTISSDLREMSIGSKKNIENRAYQTDRKSTHLAVNLRCMKLDNSLATLFSGSGITKDSDPLTECIEIQNKIATIKKVL